MKNNINNPYATNKGGRIQSPKGKPQDEPKSTKNEGTDLRAKRG